MTESHVATAQKNVTGKYDREILDLVRSSDLHSWKKMFARFMSNIQCAIYPVSMSSLFILITLVTSLSLANVDVPCGGMRRMKQFIPGESFSPLTISLATCIVFSFCVWFVSILLLRYTLRLLLLYKGWLIEDPIKKASYKTYIWAVLLKILTKKRPMLYSFQSCLPRLPLPSLEETMKRYLCTVRPLLDEEKYENMKDLAYEFQNGVGKKLQLYLWLKSWWASNYVSDWWEEYAYLSRRTSLLVHSNWYGLDCGPLPTKNQVARAATLIYASSMLKNLVETQNLKPVAVRNFIPLCASQYERIFNTTRIPGVEKDRIVHLSDSRHIVVYHNGRYYKVMLCNKKRILKPVELQWQLQQILDDSSVPASGETQLAALTANNRTVWANARITYFSEGLNKESLKAIEDAVLVIVFYDEELDFDPNDASKINKWSQAIFHGKGYNMWLDKSINFIVSKNGRVAINCEHSWCDAPVLSHFNEFFISMEKMELKYTEDGNTVGELKETPPVPIRLKWDLQPECLELITSSTLTALDIIAEVDLQVFYHSDYGKGFIKKCKVSPDAFVQMVLQLAYYRDAGCFTLTYEAAMMRLFREGRTDTVRTVTADSCDFVLSLDNPNVSRKEKRDFFQKACRKHQESYRNVMCGKGVDRHIFCLYVLSKMLDVKSPFLEKVLEEQWKLCTSQTPYYQTGELDPKISPEYFCFGGGFAQISNEGYGVSYDINSEDLMFFHVCSQRTSSATDTTRFIGHLKKSLQDVKELFL